MSKDCPDLAMYQATAFDQFAVRTPLFLELGKRGCIHHGAVGSKLMNVNVDQGRTPHKLDRKNISRDKPGIPLCRARYVDGRIVRDRNCPTDCGF